MWISPAYRKECREWMAKGMFQELSARVETEIDDALSDENPSWIASNLGSLALCYYCRGMVAVMADNPTGWADVQAGYWAALYARLFELKAVALGWCNLSGSQLTEMVLLLGLARLFQKEGDALRLSEEIATHFSWELAIGDRMASGRKLLQSILEPETPVTRAELLQDRKECCQRREAWPTRPTEIDPFGVLDIEIMLRFPAEAAFQCSGEFKPTDEDLITHAIVAYHTWYR
jgi:hypothetical protein